MDMSRFFSVLWRSKWLVVTGLVVAVLASLTAGFRVENGSMEPRAESSFTAATLVMLSGAGIPLYQAESPGQALTNGTTAPREQNLSKAAVMYAYIISGSSIRDDVTRQVGPLSASESISAVQRTTQPSGSERFPGRLDLPIIEIHGTAASPERAVQLAETATASFHSFVAQQQEAAKLAPEARVELANIQDAAVTENNVSNTVAPLIAVGAGTFLAFIALIFILDNARRTRRRRIRRAADETSTIHALDLDEFDGPSNRRDGALEPAARR
jgi:capsular polysaccharide biosynthesis protein